MFDSHCHLDFFSDELAEYLRMAKLAGVRGWFVPGCNMNQWSALAALKEKQFEGRKICVGVGLHPWWAESSESTDTLVSDVERTVRRLDAVAIGECGLDRNRGGPLPQQRVLLEAQLQLARELNLPVVFHQVGAIDEFFAVLKRVGLPHAGGVVHGFGGDAHQAKALIRRGLLLGVGPAVLSESRRRLREAVAQTSLENWLLETDAPDPRDPKRPLKKQSVDLLSVRDEVARIRGLKPDIVDFETTERARKLFGLARG